MIIKYSFVMKEVTLYINESLFITEMSHAWKAALGNDSQDMFLQVSKENSKRMLGGMLAAGAAWKILGHVNCGSGLSEIQRNAARAAADKRVKIGMAVIGAAFLATGIKRMVDRYKEGKKKDEREAETQARKEYMQSVTMTAHAIQKDEDPKNRAIASAILGAAIKHKNDKVEDIEASIKSEVGEEQYRKFEAKMKEVPTETIDKIEKESKKIKDEDIKKIDKDINEVAKKANDGEYDKEAEKAKQEAEKKDSDDKKDDDVERDKDGNILKHEEVKDKDGKKIKVVTHTGPRGGKFYWPDGAPKDAEHKVYVESQSLSDYIKDIIL